VQQDRILAAIALPQYQKAVERTRVTQVIPILKALAMAEEEYRLIYGDYTNNFNELTIGFGEYTYVSGSMPSLRGKDFTISMTYEGGFGAYPRAVECNSDVTTTALASQSCYLVGIVRGSGNLFCVNGIKTPVSKIKRCENIGFTKPVKVKLEGWEGNGFTN
jgi:Tfp pilus assembly protein PilE